MTASLSALVLLRGCGPLLLAAGAAWGFDWMCRRRGLQPPGLRQPWRRIAAAAVVAGILWTAVFAQLGEVGTERKVDLSTVPIPALFLLHALLAAALLAWFLLGFAAVPAPAPVLAADAAGPALPPVLPVEVEEPVEAHGEGVMPPAALAPSQLGPLVPASLPAGMPMAALADAAAAPREGFFARVAAQLGLVARDVPREVSLGVLIGVGSWAVVLTVLIVVGLSLNLVSGGDRLTQAPSQFFFLATLPFAVRALMSLSAGVVEEVFFRGFLQPRVGIALSTLAFALAHVSYGQPMEVLGVTLLSVIYGLLVRWRQTIWPAMAAHVLFDGVQMLVVIPLVMRLMGLGEVARAGGPGTRGPDARSNLLDSAR